MSGIGIALDLGTSGFRGQAIDLKGKSGNKIISTAISTRHPLPGANVIDHLHYALEVGLESAHEVVIEAVNKIIENLRIDKSRIAKVAVCGNPIQLSLFQEIEIRDLAYAGERKLKALGVVPPKRDAQVVEASAIRGLGVPKEAQVIIPPAVRHEIGADALAMMIQTGMLEKEEIAICTDYGTNAEMALIVNGVVYTGSTAAGPALEGQHIECGLLALPGAISDIMFQWSFMEEALIRPYEAGRRGLLATFVLDNEMMPKKGALVDPVSGRVESKGEIRAVGITGTGVVALLAECLKASIIKIPKILTPDGVIHLQDGVFFTEKDLIEAGKAIGSVRAGHITLCQEAGISLDQVETAYMSGASGTYVDALKAQSIGMIPANVKKIYQVGNTSLAMARDLIMKENQLWEMKKIADELRQHHCMFASSKTFQNVFILELAYWTEGMPIDMYRRFLGKYNIPPLPEISPEPPQIIRTVERDIPDFGHMGLKIVRDIGEIKRIIFEGCIGDGACIAECPEKALIMNEIGNTFEISINLSLCDGVACRRCERACKEHVFDLIKLLASKG
jgi:methylamine methyltransferase corrinoid protein reductive activase